MVSAPVPTARMRMNPCAVSICSVLPLPQKGLPGPPRLFPPNSSYLYSQTEAQPPVKLPDTFMSSGLCLYGALI